MLLKSHILLCVITLGIALVEATLSSHGHDILNASRGIYSNIDDIREEYEGFKLKFKKTYSLSENNTRFHNFKSNYLAILEHNNRQSSYKLAINAYADLSLIEIKNMFRPIDEHITSPNEINLYEDNDLYLSTMNDLGYINNGNVIDYRKKNILLHSLNEPRLSNSAIVDWRFSLPAVRQQGVCNSGYALAATAAVESAYFVNTKTERKFSEQQIVDCDTTNKHCAGGSPLKALTYLRDSDGHITYGNYPYTEDFIKCDAEYFPPSLKISNVIHVNTSSTAKIELTLRGRPITSMVTGSSFAFIFYAEGVITEEACKDADVLDHSVLIAGFGYDELTQKHYWLVRNSFSFAWGLDGYGLLERSPPGSDRDVDTCKIVSNQHKAYPTIELI